MGGRRSLRDVRHLGRYKIVRRLVTLVAVCMSGLLQAFAIKAFVTPAGLLSGGFTGLAILIDRVAALAGLHIPTSVGMLALNVPVALLCWRGISHRFVVFSLLQVGFSSLFLACCPFEPLLQSTVLNVLFGGVLMGTAVGLALKSGASSGGTDFIALWISNKTGRTIWEYVFTGNCLMFCVFGTLFGWEHAAYSVVFHFVMTKTLDGMYRRYRRSTLQITTERPNEVAGAYLRAFRHGMSRVEAHGCYSGRPMALLTTVVSSYEVSDAVALVRGVDPRAVVNIFTTDDFVGNFHRAPADEPIPAEVAATPECDPAAEAAALVGKTVVAQARGEMYRKHRLFEVDEGTQADADVRADAGARER